ncbi:TetR/AcrR family transcriptional regulator [Mycolicibacterium sphagni]|nr:TetR/AcrR family transcriptional regulator [Mycolicibacterium sphagni]
MGTQDVTRQSSAPARDRTKGPVGRPKVVGLGEKRREEIVTAALQVFSAHGFHRTSMSDIARQAGVGQGTLYRYFANKRDLLDHVFDHAVSQIAMALDLSDEAGPFDSPDEALGLIEIIGTRLFALTDNDSALLRFLTVECGAIDEELRHRVAGLASSVDVLLTQLFERLAGEDTETANLPLAGRLVIGVAGPALVMSLRGNRDAAQRSAFLATATAIVDHGLLASAEEPVP